MRAIKNKSYIVKAVMYFANNVKATERDYSAKLCHADAEEVLKEAENNPNVVSAWIEEV
jgi:hypothetical protein